MKIIKQQKLLSSILSSDILYFTANSSKKNSNFFSNKIELKNKTQYLLLNVVLFLQSVKQVIRLLQYHLKHYKNFLQVITSNTLYNEILEQVSKNFNSKDGKINVRNKLDSKLNSKVVAYIGSDIAQDLQRLITKTFNSNINSILLINSDFNKNVFGNYKLFTSVNNYKKLVFLIVIILLAQTNSNTNLINNTNLKKS
jgi:hypothetical protein